MSFRFPYFMIALSLFVSCNLPNMSNTGTNKYFELNGEAQGTSFTVIHDGEQDYSKEIQQILIDVNEVLSLWVPTSELCLLNKDTTEAYIVKDPYGYFQDVFTDAKTVYHNTQGYFDPSINELIEDLGFGLKKVVDVDLARIKKRRKDYSFSDDHVSILKLDSITHSLTIKKDKNTSLNFNGNAQGYAIDAIAKFLDTQAVTDYYIEVGGELIVKGKNPNNKKWSIGIDKPEEGNRTTSYKVELDDQALATSGSYRKYKIINGKKYSHTLDPIQGVPTHHNLLSVTVMMKSCSLADAYATAFMSMGKEKTLQFLSSHPEEGIEALLIFEEDGSLKTINTAGFIIQ